VYDETSRCEYSKLMEVYLHTFSASIFHAQEISFMPRPLYPLSPSGLHSTVEHRRLALARRRTPIAQIPTRHRNTKNTVCCRTLLRRACSAGTGQPRAGTHSWTRPLDWGASLSPNYTFHSVSSLYSSVIRQGLLLGDIASVH